MSKIISNAESRQKSLQEPSNRNPSQEHDAKVSNLSSGSTPEKGSLFRRLVLKNSRIIHSLPLTGKTSFVKYVREELQLDAFEPEQAAEEMGFLEGLPDRFLLKRHSDLDQSHKRRVILSEMGLITKGWLASYPMGIVVTSLSDDPFRSILWPNGKISVSVGFVDPSILVERSKNGVSPELALKIVTRWMTNDNIRKRVSLEAHEYLQGVVDLSLFSKEAKGK